MELLPLDYTSFIEEKLKNTSKKSKNNKSALEIYREYHKKQKKQFISSEFKDASFDIKGFTNEFDIILQYESVLNYSGKIKGNIITVNSMDIDYRQRFTLAHELGHYFMHTKNPKKERVDYYRGLDQLTLTRIKEEKEANLFAGDILMPQDIFTDLYHQLIKEGKETVEFIHEMAHAFDTSKQSIILRLKTTHLVKKDQWIWYE